MDPLNLFSVVEQLPLTSRLIVVAIGIASLVALGLTIMRNDVMDTRMVILATVGGFFLIDLLYIHPSVWENVPALMYWLAKPIVVGYGMYLAATQIGPRLDAPVWLELAVAGLAGIVLLQLYYTVIPIPTVSGDAIQIGLIGNLTGGLSVHGIALLVALGIVIVGMRVTGD